MYPFSRWPRFKLIQGFVSLHTILPLSIWSLQASILIHATPSRPCEAFLPVELKPKSKWCRGYLIQPYKLKNHPETSTE